MKINREGSFSNEFGACSDVPISWCSAVQFARSHEAMLPSLEELARYRMRGNDAIERHATRTAAIFYMGDEGFMMGFDDSPSDNKVVSDAEQGLRELEMNQVWRVRRDGCVSRMLARAREAGRTVPLQPHTCMYDVRLDRETPSALERALFNEAAHEYHSLLSREHDGCKAAIHAWSEDDLNRIGLNHTHALLQPVTLGARVCYPDRLHPHAPFVNVIELYGLDAIARCIY